MENKYIGKRYNQLIFLKYSHKVRTKNRWNHYYLCKCDCGKEKIMLWKGIIAGHTKSCGCLHKKWNILTKTKHGKCYSRIYKIYASLKNRCFNKNNNAYKHYGERGIIVCNKWTGDDGFMSFYNWAMANGYKESLTIERVNVNGNYEPSNCKWATWEEQQNNKRKTVISKTGYTGVFPQYNSKKYKCEVCHKSKIKHIGTFKTIKESVEARNKYIKDNNLLNKTEEYRNE